MKFIKDKFVSFVYKQPVHGGPYRFGKVVAVRNMKLYPQTWNPYRWLDSAFQRTDTLVTILQPDGHYRSFYAERSHFVRNPLLGWLRFHLTKLYHKVFTDASS